MIGKGFRQEIYVLVFRRYMRDAKLSLIDVVSQEVVTNIDVLRVRVGHRVNCQLDRTVVVHKNLTTRILQIRL